MARAMLLILILLSSISCTSLPSVREVSDRLETIPIGTRLDEFPASEEEWWLQLGQAEKQGVLFYSNLILRSSPGAGVEFYRQWPKGVLLDLDASDVFVFIPVAEAQSGFGVVHVFFDSSMRYRGYLGISQAQDDRERFAHEVASYFELGLDHECEMALLRASMSSMDAHHWEQYVPYLPISKNKGKNREQLERLKSEGRKYLLPNYSECLTQETHRQ